MKMTLINGRFDTEDALEILTQMVHVKIKYHEKKINASTNEEDVKMREGKIKQLQKDLFEIREKYTNDRQISIFAEVDFK